MDVTASLYRIASLSTNVEELPVLLNLIVEETRAALEADVVVFFETDDQGGGFTPVAASGLALDSVGRLTFVASAGVLGQAISARQPRLAPPGDPMSVQLDASSLAYAPAFGATELAGCLVAGWRKGQPQFDPSTLRLLGLLAHRAGEAWEIAGRLAEARQRVRELSILLQSTAGASSSLDLNVILKSMSVHLLMASAAQVVTLYEWDRESNRIVVLMELWRGTPVWARQPGTAFPLADSPAARSVLEMRRPLRISADESKIDPRDLNGMSRLGCSALLLVPLQARGEALGLAELGDRRGARAFVEREIELAQALANEAAVAIMNSRLHTLTQQRVEELALLADVGREVMSSLDVDEVLQRLMGRVKQVLRVQAVQLLLCDPAGNLAYRVGEGLGVSRSAVPIPAGHGIAGWVSQNGQPRVVNDVPQEPQFQGAVDCATGVLIRSVLAVPLSAQQRVIGVIEAMNKVEGRFSDSDVVLLQSVASSAAAAIENARLYHKAEEERRKLNAVLNDTTDAVIVASEAGAIALVNDAAARAFGFDATEAVGRPAREVLPVPELAHLLTHPGALPSAEFEAPGGRVYQANVSTVKGVGRVAVLRNITPMKELERLRSNERARVERAFKHVVAPRVAERLLTDTSNLQLGGQRQEVSTLFADLHGFTSFAEQTSPETLIEALNLYLSLAGQAVLQHEGTLDKFMGDAVMALFNAPAPQADHALRAVRAAVEIRRMSRVFRSPHVRPGQLRFCIGVSVGEAIVGNVGTPDIFNYTAIGDCVNLAKRLQEYSQPDQILITEGVWWRVRDQVKTRALPPIRLKGRSGLEPVYEVLT